MALSNDERGDRKATLFTRMLVTGTLSCFGALWVCGVAPTFFASGMAALGGVLVAVVAILGREIE